MKLHKDWTGGLGWICRQRYAQGVSSTIPRTGPRVTSKTSEKWMFGNCRWVSRIIQNVRSDGVAPYLCCVIYQYVASSITRCQCDPLDFWANIVRVTLGWGIARLQLLVHTSDSHIYICSMRYDASTWARSVAGRLRVGLRLHWIVLWLRDRTLRRWRLKLWRLAPPLLYLRK